MPTTIVKKQRRLRVESGSRGPAGGGIRNSSIDDEPEESGKKGCCSGTTGRKNASLPSPRVRGPGCPLILDGGCLKGTEITKEELENFEVVRMECSNSQCDITPFIHVECYEALENHLVKVISNISWARSWTEHQRRSNLWDKKGYTLLKNQCRCLCGRGTICRDLNYKQQQEDTQKRERTKKPKGRKVTKQLPILNHDKGTRKRGGLNSGRCSTSPTFGRRPDELELSSFSAFDDQSAKPPESESVLGTSAPDPTVATSIPDDASFHSANAEWIRKKRRKDRRKNPSGPSRDFSRSAKGIDGFRGGRNQRSGWGAEEEDARTSIVSDERDTVSHYCLEELDEFIGVSPLDVKRMERSEEMEKLRRSKDIRTQEQFFEALKGVLVGRTSPENLLPITHEEITRLFFRTSQKLKDYLKEVGGFSALIRRNPQYGMTFVTHPENGIFLNDSTSGKTAWRHRSESDNLMLPLDPGLIRDYGIIQNVFPRFGFIECTKLSTNVFFVPSQVTAESVEAFMGDDVPTTNTLDSMLQRGDRVQFVAQQQVPKNGCGWLAIQVRLLGRRQSQPQKGKGTAPTLARGGKHTANASVTFGGKKERASPDKPAVGNMKSRSKARGKSGSRGRKQSIMSPCRTTNVSAKEKKDRGTQLALEERIELESPASLSKSSRFSESQKDSFSVPDAGSITDEGFREGEEVQFDERRFAPHSIIAPFANLFTDGFVDNERDGGVYQLFPRQSYGIGEMLCREGDYARMREMLRSCGI